MGKAAHGVMGGLRGWGFWGSGGALMGGVPVDGAGLLEPPEDRVRAPMAC